MGKTKDLGHLAHIVAYNAENHITVPAGITMHTNQLVASQAWVTTALGSYALSSSLGSYVPTSRTITINGTTYDLSANRSWDITSMIYPAAGIPLSTGSAWGSSITNNSANWNTAYGWGNHASAGYLTGITSTQVTTALGFTPVTNARTITINGTSFDLSANRSWTITSTETDTLATVTSRGATTSDIVTFTSTTSAASVIARNDGNGTQWRGRIGHFNATSDRSIWLATYNGNAVVGVHNNALTAWADLYVNTVDGAGGGTVRLPSSTFINGSQAIHAGNIGSQSVSYATSSGSVSGLTLTSSANNLNPNDVTQNQLGYNTSVSLFGQTDGGLYSSAYSSSWIHQIFGDFRSGQIAIRGKNNGTWQAWRTVLDSSNYTSYNDFSNLYATNYFQSITGRAAGNHGYASTFRSTQSASSNFIPYSFESDYGNHSWGIVARYRINQVGADRPSIQFSAAGGDDRWNIGYCTGSDWDFRITQNMAYRNDNANSDGWGTERFRIDTSGNIIAGGNFTGYHFNAGYSTRLGEIWGYGGVYRSSGDMMFGTESGGWRFHYQNSQRLYIGTDGNIWMSWLGDYISNRIGQDVRSGAAPTFNNIYNYGWFRNYGDSGLYNQDYGCHIARNSQSSHGSWTVWGYTKAGYVGMNLQDPQGYNSNLMFEQGRGGVYQENGGGWHFYYDRPNDCLGLSGSDTYDWVRACTNGKHRITNDTWCDATSWAYTFSNISDGRLKENIITVDSALEKVLQLRGVYYNWIIDTENRRHIGLIAQETAAVCPEVVNYHDETDTYSVNYSELSGLFIESTKELNQKLIDANTRIEILEAKLNQLLNA